MQMQEAMRRGRFWESIALSIVLLVIAVAIFASGCSVAPRLVEKPLCRIIDGVGACRVP